MSQTIALTTQCVNYLRSKFQVFFNPPWWTPNGAERMLLFEGGTVKLFESQK